MAESVLNFLGLFNKLTAQKSFLYIRNYGFRAFLKKAREKVMDNTNHSADSSAFRDYPVINFIRQKIAPLNLEIVDSEPERVNMLISIINFKYFFGGYLSVFNLAKKLTAEGFKVRMVIIDECKFEPDLWKEEIKKYEGLEGFFDYVEVEYAVLRSKPIKVSGKDVFMATSWWTAHIANYAIKYLNSHNFLYLSQEYEPIFYPMGSFAALAMESYNLPHYAVFSTEILREYFSQNRLGVFRDGHQIGEESSVAIENAILKFQIDKTKMASRAKKKLLFYARPEEHASRNMFELGMIALSNVIRSGYFDVDNWEFYGIGSVEGENKKISLHDNVSMKLLPKLSLNEYKEMLPGFDIGLSLMLSPHPSIVPLEMAAAGMLVITNTFANKTAERLKEISTNIIPAEPTTEGIENGLVRAIKNIENYDSRVSGANVHWSQNWEETFNKQCMEKIKGFIRQCMEKTKGSNDKHDINQHLFTGREERLANAYIETAAKNPNTFVDVISPEDEMYITSRNSTEQKDTAKYLYFIIGRECFKSIENIIRFSGKSFREVRTFLDFACGYGRVTRFLIQEIESTKVWVSDIYKDAVDFQKKYFMVNGFYSETEPSRLVFPGNFEIIYVGSLFSHLPANRFEEWLSTLYNVLDDDGILIFSTHGESLCSEGLRIDPSGFTFFNWSESRSLSSKEYGSTFVKRDWVERLGKKIGIANIYFLEKELRGFQDIYVVTKKNIPQMNNLMPTHYPMGNIDSVRMTQDGGLSIFGWAIGKGIDDPVKEICIYANDELLGKATLGMPRPDVEKHFGRADCLNSGWEFKVGGSVLKEVISKDTGFSIIKVFIKSESDDVSYLISSY